MSKIQERRKEFVDELVTLMESGELTWNAGYNGVGGDYNATTGKAYRAGNKLRLWASSRQQGFKDPRWMTFKQAKEKGYLLKKGSKGTWLEKYQPPEYEKKIDENGDIWISTKPIKSGFIKGFYVFNAEQFENVPELNLPKYTHDERNEILENIIENSEAKITFDQVSQNYYIPKHDEIHAMGADKFEDLEKWYGTVIHEIGHSTGHASRLNRPMVASFGTPDYAKEELRAELTAAFIGQEFGLSMDPAHKEDHAAYLQSWIKVLKEDPTELFKAAVDAENAVEYIKENMLNKELLKELPKEAILPKIKEQIIITDKETALKAIEQNPWTLKHVDKELKKDRDVVLLAIKKEPLTLQYAEENLKADISLVTEAVEKKAQAFNYAADVLKVNENFVKQVVNKQPLALEFADKRLRNNFSIVYQAAQKDIHALEFTDETFKDDGHLMSSLYRKNPQAFEYASERLQKEFEQYKRREYWVVEFQESRNNSIKKDYIGKIVTNEILEELKQSDDHIYTHNKTWGEDEFGNETDKWMPYSKTYFDHYKDGKVVEHVRVDIGDGVKDNNDLYQYIEESIEKINQAEALQEVTSKTKEECWIVENNETGKNFPDYSNRKVTKDLLNEIKEKYETIRNDEKHESDYRIFFGHLKDGKTIGRIVMNIGTKYSLQHHLDQQGFKEIETDIKRIESQKLMTQEKKRPPLEISKPSGKGLER